MGSQSSKGEVAAEGNAAAAAAAADPAVKTNGQVMTPGLRFFFSTSGNRNARTSRRPFNRIFDTIHQNARGGVFFGGCGLGGAFVCLPFAGFAPRHLNTVTLLLF